MGTQMTVGRKAEGFLRFTFDPKSDNLAELRADLHMLL